MRTTLPFLVAISVFSTTIAARSQSAEAAIEVSYNIADRYVGTVTTDSRDVTTKSGGTHKCGMSKGTPVTVLADVAEQDGFAFDGEWNRAIKDFVITEIEGRECRWVLTVNGRPRNGTEYGGCRLELAEGDKVHWFCR